MFAVTLECRHTRFTDHEPTIGEGFYCVRCGDERFVTSVVPEVRIRCVSCHWGKGFGMAEQAAYAAARRHHNRFPEHVTQVLRGSRVLSVMLPTKIFHVTGQYNLTDTPPY